MASAKLNVEENGRFIRISYDTPGSIFPKSVADYFRVKPGKIYDRVLVNETFVPSVSIGKQAIRDPEDPGAAPIELFAINALTPASMRETYLYHAQVTSFDPQWKDSDIEGIRSVVAQDKVVVEAIQQRFDTYRDTDEVSVKPDNMGLRCRRAIAQLLRAEAMAT